MTSEAVKYNKTVEWLDEVLSNLQIDKTTLELGVASQEKKAIYDRLAAGETDKVLIEFADLAKIRQVAPLLGDYLSYFADYPDNPFLTFAVKMGSHEISFWIEVEEYSSDLERDIIMADAKMNVKYEDSGFHLHSMMVEACDELPAPPSYKILFSSTED